MEFTDFKELSDSIASIKDINLTKFIDIKISTKGKEVDIDDLSFIGPHGELVYILPDGTLRKVAVHISAIKEMHKDSYKYHIFNCKTLQDMKYEGKEDKYKCNSRTDGNFFMIMTDKSNNICFNDFYPLNICNHCLRLYNEKYNDNLNMNLFSLQKYADFGFDNLDIWKDMPYDMEVAPQKYIKEWKEISKRAKEKVNYTCQKCGVNLINHKMYLHAHHIDMNVRNNSSENLKILCIHCHGMEYNHTHITRSKKWKDFTPIKHMIRGQGI